MARIRYLKPEFFKDEDIKDLPFEVRLFYAGLWIQADREGRLEDRPERLKIEIFPYDEFDVEKALEILCRKKKNSGRPFIIRYEIDGQRYIQIPSWHKHQRPHHTEKDSEIPPVPKEEPSKNGVLTVKEQEGMGMEIGMGIGMEKGKGKKGSVRGKGEKPINPNINNNLQKNSSSKRKPKLETGESTFAKDLEKTIQNIDEKRKST